MSFESSDRIGGFDGSWLVVVVREDTNHGAGMTAYEQGFVQVGNSTFRLPKTVCRI